MNTFLHRLIGAFKLLTKNDVILFTMGKEAEDGFSLIQTYDKEFVYSVVDFLNECIEKNKNLN